MRITVAGTVQAFHLIPFYATVEHRNITICGCKGIHFFYNTQEIIEINWFFTIAAREESLLFLCCFRKYSYLCNCLYDDVILNTQVPVSTEQSLA